MNPKPEAPLDEDHAHTAVNALLTGWHGETKRRKRVERKAALWFAAGVAAATLAKAAGIGHVFTWLLTLTGG